MQREVRSSARLARTRSAVIAILAFALTLGILPILPTPAAAAASKPDGATSKFLDPMPPPESASWRADDAAPAEAAPATAAPAPGPALDGPEGWTPSAHWKRNDNGTITASLYSRPTFRRDGDRWVELNRAVTRSADGGAEATGGVRPVRFGARATAPLLLDLPKGVVRVTAKDAAPAKAAVDSDGSAVTYADIAKDTDLRYVVTESGVAKELVLKTADAPRSFTFHVSDPTKALGQAADLGLGHYRFDTDVDGLRLHLSPAYAYPAAQRDGITPRHLESARQTVVPAGDGYDVTISLGEEWAKDKAFPIVLDPSFTWQGTDANFFDGTISDGASCNGNCGIADYDDNFGAGTYIGNGYDNNPGRSLLKFDLGAVVPRGSRIDSATMAAYLNGCIGFGADFYCDEHDYTVHLHRLRAPFNVGYTRFSEINWDPAVMSSVYRPRYAPLYRETTTYNLNANGQVQRWASGQEPNYGFLMKLSSEPPNIGGPSYASNENTKNEPHPRVDVTYAIPPNAPQNVRATGGISTANVTWSAPAPNGGAPVTGYTITAHYATGGVAGQQSCNCLSATFSLPAGQYRFGVVARNEVGPGPEVFSNTVSVGPQPALDKSAVLERTGQPQDVYAPGDEVVYTVSVQNPSGSNMTLSGVTDTPADGLSITTDPVMTDGNVPCGALCTLTPAGVLQIGSFTLGPYATKTFVYNAIVMASTVRCGDVLNNLVATTTAGVTSSFRLPIQVCGAGIGFEPWWTFVGMSAGPQASAQVNVANGNLALQHTDSTAVQAHGRFSYVMRRTYNSQDLNQIVPLPGRFGKGWTINIGQTDELAAGGVTATGLRLPTVDDLLALAAVTLVDRDGTRHVFRPKQLPNPLEAATQAPLGTFVPKALTLDAANYTRICIDQAFSAPPGVKLSLWRYIQVYSTSTATPCAPDPGKHATVLGFAAMRPDRVRYEFSALGQLLSMTDGAGVEMRYQYATPDAVTGELPLLPDFLGGLPPLLRVYEPRSCADPTALTCRAMTFNWDPVASKYTVTDPAGRATVYNFNLLGNLTSAVNPDGSTLNYTYEGLAGSACDGVAGQLCSVSDPRGNVTSFSYTPDPTSSLFPPRIDRMRDRRSNATTISFTPTSATTTRGSERRQFLNIDIAGRVPEIREGDTAGNIVRQAFYTWDAVGTTCRQPDAAVDNNLCRVVRKSGAATPDEDTSYLYNSEGRTLRERRAIGNGLNADTTFGYKALYVRSGEALAAIPDQVAGMGEVTSYVEVGQTKRDTPTTLLYVSDIAESLTPRGNKTLDWSPWKTVYDVDDYTTVAMNLAPAAGPCSIAGLSNTGLLCSVTGPVYNAGAGDMPTTTKYTYDTFGQRATMSTPNHVVKGGGLLMPAYTYTYFSDADRDLSGLTSAGGWLKGVTDPDGNFVAFAYDRAGNRVRTWDRNATEGLALATFPGTIAAPTSPQYSETLFGAGALPTDAYSNPWRYPVLSRDALGNTTRYPLNDKNGNPEVVRSPRGNPDSASSIPGYDVEHSYDANDNLVSTLLPLGGAATEFTYDAHDNITKKVDSLGNVTAWRYDAVGRKKTELWTRGPNDGSEIPPSCRVSASPADDPLPAGEIACSRTWAYDGVDNLTGQQDGNGQTTTFAYDGLHRQTSQSVPRNDGQWATLRTDTRYDVDGNVLDVCPPREFTEGSGACSATGLFSTHNAFDILGRRTSMTTYQASGVASTTSYAYDADGNAVAITDARGHTTTDTYDLLGRRTASSVPRADGVSYATRWVYDPSGNTTAIIRPGTLDTGDGSNGPLVKNGTECPEASPCVIPANAQYSSITLTDGAWLAAPAGGRVELRVSGPVSVCANCGITLAGRGPAGGLGANGGGNGGGRNGTSGTAVGGGGGGGGHVSRGTDGTGVIVQATGGLGGSAYGTADLSDTTAGNAGLGSGGGGGGAGGAEPGGRGGNGGGYLRLTAESVSVLGTITADGAAGANAQTAGAGGGGSAGSIWLTAPAVTLASPGSLSVRGGAPGAAAGGGNGGAGSSGRVRIDADTMNIGTASTDVRVSASGIPAATPSAPTLNPAWGSYSRKTVGRVHAYSYDAAHRMVDEVVGADHPSALLAGTPDARGGSNARSRSMYDADGNVVATFEPRAFVGSTTTPDARYMTRAEYDRNGRQTAQYLPRYDNAGAADPNHSTTQTGQCPTGAAPAAVSGVPAYPAGVGVCVTRYQYDGGGRVVRQTMSTSNGSDNRYFTADWTDDGLLAKLTAPSPASDAARVTTAQYVYDGVGRQTKTVDALGRSTVTAYTSDGLVASVTPPAGAVGHAVSYAYNANGSLTRETNALAQNATRSYTANGLMKEASDTGGNVTRYSYDLTGNITRVLSPSGVAGVAPNAGKREAVNTYSHDNLLLQVDQPVTASDTRRTFYTYDRGGRKLSQRAELSSPSGNKTSARQTFEWFPNDQAAAETGRYGEVISYDYDPAGNIRRVVDNTSSTVIDAHYYLDGLLRQANDGRLNEFYSYDAAGGMAGRSIVDNGVDIEKTTFVNGTAGLPKSMSSSTAGTTSWTYDTAGRPGQATMPNGIKVTPQYNNDDTLQYVSAATPGGTVRARWDYTYDALYRVKSQGFSGTAGSGGSMVTALFEYRYDAAGRLDEFKNGGVAKPIGWDKDGNRASYDGTSYVYGIDGSIQSTTKDATTKQFAYEAFGGVQNDGDCHVYDGFDRLKQTTADCAPGGELTERRYDGMDRLRRETKGSVTTELHYDGLGQSLVKETAPGVDERYVLDPDGTARAMVTNTNTVEHLLRDGQGNVGAVLSSGSATQCTVRYDPYGTPLSSTGLIGEDASPCNSGSAANGLWYASGRRNSGGSYQFGARTYNPTTGSFMTPDAARVSGPGTDLSIGVDPLTSNRYAYVNGDPVNFIDPFGHKKCSRWNVGCHLKKGAQQVIGVGKGMVESTVGAVKGVGEMAWGTAGLMGLRGEEVQQQALDTLGQVASAIKENPLESLKTIGYALVEETVKDWRAGNYGEALGHVGFEIITTLATGGLAKTEKLSKLTKLNKVGKGLETVDDVAGGAKGLSKADEIADGGQAMAKAGEAADGAKAAEKAAKAGDAVADSGAAAKVADSAGSGNGAAKAGKAGKAGKATDDLPNQVHHFATNKNKRFAPKFQKIADEYGLDLDGAWNKELMPHRGRHPNAYHEFVLDNMSRAAREAGDDAARFLELFEKHVKAPVRNNPQLLRKSGWM